jgi:hypothetical protein
MATGFRVYSWGGKTTPNIDLVKDIERVVWWDEEHIAIKNKKKVDKP